MDWFQTQPPERELVRSGLAHALYLLERWEDAQTLYDGLAGEFPENVSYLGSIGRIAARLGDRDHALRVSEELASLDVPYMRGTNTRERARIFAILEDEAEAVRLLRQALGEGVQYGVWFHRDIDFESLHDYPPFQELLRPKG